MITQWNQPEETRSIEKIVILNRLMKLYVKSSLIITCLLLLCALIFYFDRKFQFFPLASALLFTNSLFLVLMFIQISATNKTFFFDANVVGVRHPSDAALLNWSEVESVEKRFCFSGEIVEYKIVSKENMIKIQLIEGSREETELISNLSALNISLK